MPTIVIATTSWGIAAALLALCLHTIWEGGSISIREKFNEVLQYADAQCQRLSNYQKYKSHKREDSASAGADVDAAIASATGNTSMIDSELQKQGSMEDV